MGQLRICYQVEFRRAQPDVVAEHDSKRLIRSLGHGVNSCATCRIQIADPATIGVRPNICMTPRRTQKIQRELVIAIPLRARALVASQLASPATSLAAHWSTLNMNYCTPV